MDCYTISRKERTIRSYILRPTKGCYVHGTMDGEGLDEGRGKMETAVLRVG